MTASPPIRDVPDTARWVAFYRAMENERPDAIFRDPFAKALSGEEGEAIVAPALRAGNAQFKFGPAESTGFFEPLGWGEVEYRSIVRGIDPLPPDHAAGKVLAVGREAGSEEAPGIRAIFGRRPAQER